MCNISPITVPPASRSNVLNYLDIRLVRKEEVIRGKPDKPLGFASQRPFSGHCLGVPSMVILEAEVAHKQSCVTSTSC